MLQLRPAAAAAAAKSLQSCPTLCDPIDGSPPGSPVPGVLFFFFPFYELAGNTERNTDTVKVFLIVKYTDKAKRKSNPHWSGLPFPSPMHESEKWKWSRSVVSNSSDPMDCSLPGSSVRGIFQARVLEWVPLRNDPVAHSRWRRTGPCFGDDGQGALRVWI